MEKDDLRIEWADRASVGKITTVSAVLCNHELIRNCSSNRLHLFCSHSERPKCCRICISVMDNIKILQIQDLRGTNEVIKTGLWCSRHQFSIVYIVYDTMNKRYIIEQQMKICNVIPRIKIVCVIKDLECFAYNRYINPSLRLHINSKFQNSEKAEHKVKTIIKKIHQNEKVRQTHSENFIM